MSNLKAGSSSGERGDDYTCKVNEYLTEIKNDNTSNNRKKISE